MPPNISRPIGGRRHRVAPPVMQRAASAAQVQPACTSATSAVSARPGRQRAHRPTTSAAPRIIEVSPASCTATRADARCARPAARTSAPAAARRRASSARWRARRRRWVKKSTMMLAPCSWHQGRHSEMASAMPNCVSSTSPGIGLRSQRAHGDAGHRHQRHRRRRPPRRPARTRSGQAPQQRPRIDGSRRGARRAPAAYFLYFASSSRASCSIALPLAAALVHVGDPVVVQRRRGLDPVVEFGWPGSM